MKFKRIVCIALLCATVLCGCDNGKKVPSEIVVSGDSGYEDEAKPFPAESCGVMLKKEATKVVSLSPATTEIICELGFGDRLAAVSNYCDYPEGLSMPKVGSTENPDIDAIIALEPDVVFTLSLLSERDRYMLNHAGIEVLTPKNPESIEDYYTMYKEIAAAFYGKTISDPQKGEFKNVAVASDARKQLEDSAVQIESFVYITEMMTLSGNDTFAGAVLGLCGENLCKESGYVLPEECGEVVPKYIIADDKLSEEKLKKDKTVSKMLSGGAKMIYITSSYLERPTARTVEVFLQIKEQLGQSE